MCTHLCTLRHNGHGCWWSLWCLLCWLFWCLVHKCYVFVRIHVCESIGMMWGGGGGCKGLCQICKLLRIFRWTVGWTLGWTQWCSGSGATGAIAPVPLIQGRAPLQFLFHLFIVNLAYILQNWLNLLLTNYTYSHMQYSLKKFLGYIKFTSSAEKGY